MSTCELKVNQKHYQKIDRLEKKIKKLNQKHDNLFCIRPNKVMHIKDLIKQKTQKTTKTPTHFRATTRRSSENKATWRSMGSCSSRIVFGVLSVANTVWARHSVERFGPFWEYLADSISNFGVVENFSKITIRFFCVFGVQSHTM